EPPNNAFKPKPLRSAQHMAGTACHVLCSTTRLGLTWVLGLVSRTAVAVVLGSLKPAASGIALGSLHARGRHRRSLVQHLGFGQAQPRHKYDRPESASYCWRWEFRPRARSFGLRPRQTPASRVAVLFGSGVGRSQFRPECWGAAA